MMSKPILTSLSNPLIKQARALRQRKARVESGLFLVEGIHHVGEAVEAGWEIQSLLYAPEILTSVFGLELASRLGARSQPISIEAMKSLAGKENPQGIIAIVRQRQMKIADLPPVTVAVALVAPQDPGNVGTILRTMDAVGAEALFLLDGGVELYHPTAVRSSMGALFWMPVISTVFDNFLTWARTGAFQLIGTSAHVRADHRALAPCARWALVLGSEQKGLSPEQLRACDDVVSLPMRGRVSSLNLAVATGALLYALSAQRQAR
ncbi:MAG: hypothetical protein B6D38_00925 [Anaerolineae bacterium UTCFX1]|jgi:TrmH family RNA methyltransferase|nr:MAG: hypothetical protein B6D38_00925 [Anaerolineae bacterium UTCFX1]